MADKITFYYNPMSRGRIVHWMLEEVESDYEIKLLDWKKAEHKTSEYLKINPMGKIPTIVHRGVVITETAAICMYLADAFPNSNLAPAIGDLDRGTYLRWFFFVASCFEPALLDIKNPRTQKVESSQLGYGSSVDTFNTLEKAISNGFILGKKFSAADVYISSSIGWGLISKQLEPRPAFQNYVKLCSDRSAFKRFTEQVGPLG